MTREEIEKYRQLLLALQRRLAGDFTELDKESRHADGGEGSGGLSDVPIHPADLGTDAFEEEMTVGLMENEAQLLIEVQDALARIEKGTFGKCEECGEAIRSGRLRAIPYARYCLRDAQKYQNSTSR
jgi:RNA polymerase-binding transcription factor DksA